MRRCIFYAIIASAITMSGVAIAAPIGWDIDQTQSYIRLTIPDQSIPVEGIGNVTIRLRDAGSTSNWTDAGGRRAFLDGTIFTQYVNDSTIDFLGGQQDVFALEQTLLRPNPAQFTGPANADNPDGTYVGTGTALAAFGARVRGTYILTFDAAFLAFRDVFFEMESGALTFGSGGNGTLAGSSTLFTIDSANLDVDGIALPLGLGQPIPDLLNEPLPNLGLFTNTGAGTITNLGGLNRQLTLNIDIPISIDISGVAVTGSATGQIVAFAAVPEVSSVTMLAVVAPLGIVTWIRRRSRKEAR